MRKSGLRLWAVLLITGTATITSSLTWAQPLPCPGDVNGDGKVTIDEIITVVGNGLYGCPANVGADQACTDTAMARCAKLDACVVNGTMIRYGHASICEARLKQQCLVALGAAGTGNNPEAVERCAQGLPSSSCNDFDLGEVVPCQTKIGTIANGGACTFPAQCVSTNCAIVNGTNCGTCAPPNQVGAGPLPVGDSCATTSCSQGFVCVSDTMQCQPRGATGDACDKDHLCGAGLSCVTPSGASAGTCETAAAAIGATCDPKRQTGPGCDPNLGLYCNGTTKMCAAVTYAMAGGQCGFVNNAVVDCTGAAVCFGAAGQTPGTCLADAAEGMPCDTVAGPSCVPPARCVTGSPTVTGGICQLADPTACK